MNETTRRILAILTEDTGEDARMTAHLYSNEGRVEQCERICALESLCRDLYERLLAADAATDMGWLDARMVERVRELGVGDPE